MNRHLKSYLLTFLTTALIFDFFSCSKTHPEAIDMSGTWIQTLETGQSIHGGQIDSVLFDTTVFTFTPSGRYSFVHFGGVVGGDSGTYAVQHDSLYFNTAIYPGVTEKYYIKAYSNTAVTLQFAVVECGQNCDTVVRSEYMRKEL